MTPFCCADVTMKALPVTVGKGVMSAVKISLRQPGASKSRSEAVAGSLLSQTISNDRGVTSVGVMKVTVGPEARLSAAVAAAQRAAMRVMRAVSPAAGARTGV